MSEETEADDIIGTICLKYPQTKIKVISNDHDFNQLLNNPNITQYSPIQKKEISVPNNLDFVFLNIYVKVIQAMVFQIYCPKTIVSLTRSDRNRLLKKIKRMVSKQYSY